MKNTDAGRRSWWDTMIACSGTAADRRNQKIFAFWVLAWALSYVSVTWLLQREPAISGAAAWAVALLPLLLGVIAVLAYLKFLRAADELLRRIQLEGLAFGFGAGVLYATSYEVLEFVAVPAASLSDTATVMMLAWVAGQLLSTWRYR